MTNNKLLMKAIEYDHGDPKRIQHFLKVYAFSKMIGECEHIPFKTQLILETAAILHDIAIVYCQREFGKCNGKLQEEYGPDIARALLDQLDYSEEIIERVCYLIGHHHTYTHIEGSDYQILVEADFLVNLYEDNCDKESAIAAMKKIFKTTTAIKILREMYDI